MGRTDRRRPPPGWADASLIDGCLRHAVKTDDPDLAGAYRSVGRLDEAIVLYQQTLTDSQRVLGADHPNQPAPTA